MLFLRKSSTFRSISFLKSFNRGTREFSQTNKNIVVLCDGTWEGPNSKTNVFTLYKELYERDEQQCVKYINGVRIRDTFWNFIMDEIAAQSINNKTREAYKYIVSNYNPGDNIWLFGFSHGAYTVRSVAGMIRNCGILRRDQLQLDLLVDRAYYDIYRNKEPNYGPNDQGSDMFRKAHSYSNYTCRPYSMGWDLLWAASIILMTNPVKFLGLWDTVGAYGTRVQNWRKI